MLGIHIANLEPRITEEILHESIDARTESLAGLRELGPPDLVHLLKHAVRNPAKQVRKLDRRKGDEERADISRLACTTMLPVSTHPHQPV